MRGSPEIRQATVFVFLFSFAVPAAFAATTLRTFPQSAPTCTNPATGARPGNEIGTGNSLPLSDKASNITPGDTAHTRHESARTPVGDDATPQGYLIAARTALAAGRTGETQRALEMAETRGLDRSVPLVQTNAPIRGPPVAAIEDALHALSARNWSRTMQIIESTIAHAGAR